jgi:hypothetical protein
MENRANVYYTPSAWDKPETPRLAGKRSIENKPDSAICGIHQGMPSDFSA